MFVRNRLLATFSIAFLSGCAAVNAPEGGPRDVKNPLLVSTTPKNGATNFSGKTITLEFDEDIRPKDINKELIITPNTGATYNVRNDRTNLILEFNKPLEENTTYFMNFRKGIEDITEGNKAPEVTLTFSTGDFLDTAGVSGRVEDYLTQLPESNVTVALYPEKDTADIRSKMPYYFTRTNADGSFQVRNIKAGNYRIYAHNDRNTNEIYDQETEKIGYLTTVVTATPKADSVIIKTVTLDTRKPFVLKTEQNLDQNTLVYNEGIEKITFKGTEAKAPERKLLTTRDESGKRITLYPDGGKLPENLIAFSIDSSGNAGVDTVKLALANKPAIPAKLSFKVAKSEVVPGEPNQIRIQFPVPVKVIGKGPFTIIEDTTKSIIPRYPEDYKMNASNTEISLTYRPGALKTAELVLDTTQLLAINGKPFQKQKIPFALSRKSTTGKISGTVKTSFKNYWVELLDEKSKVIRKDLNLKRLDYPNLEPGNYSLRVKIDENNDGKWSKGDKSLKTAPEKIYIYPKPVNVRANWEIEDIDLIF